MSGWLAYVAISLAYVWGGHVEVKASPETVTWSCPSRTEVTLAPVELAWNPKDGFGVTSSVQASQYAQRPIYCWR